MNTMIIVTASLLIFLHAIIMACGIARKSPTRKHFNRYEVVVPAVGMVSAALMLISHILDQYIEISERLYMWLQGGGFSMSYFFFALIYVSFAIRYWDTPTLKEPWHSITKYGISITPAVGIVLSVILGQFI